jgi:hypothetical protein
MREGESKGTIFAAAVEDALALASTAVPTSRARRERLERRGLKQVSGANDFIRLSQLTERTQELASPVRVIAGSDSVGGGGGGCSDDHGLHGAVHNRRGGRSGGG